MTELYLLEVNRIVEWGPQIRPTRAVVDLDAILANAEKLSTLAGCPLLAVVKADAYGHGATTVSLALESMFRANPAVLKGFAVSLLEEGIELREAGVTMPILVMGPSLMDAHSLIVDFDLMPMVSDVRHLEPISEAARRSEKVLGIHLKVDTGMGRLGLAPEELAAALELVNSLKGLELRGIASHLACADTDDPEDQSAMSAEQLRRFAELARQDKSLDQGQWRNCGRRSHWGASLRLGGEPSAIGPHRRECLVWRPLDRCPRLHRGDRATWLRRWAAQAQQSRGPRHGANWRSSVPHLGYRLHGYDRRRYHRSPRGTAWRRGGSVGPTGRRLHLRGGDCETLWN